jgi:hypothetical protein
MLLKPCATGAMLALCVIAGQVVSAQNPDPVDVTVIRAVVRHVALPELRVVSQGDRLRPIMLSDLTLAKCLAEATAPCVSQDVYLAARRETGKGTWPPALTASFESAAATSLRLGPIDDPGFTVASAASIKASPKNSARLAITRPAVIQNRALVYVQFAATWTWLVLLHWNGQEWLVEDKILLSIS